MDVTVTVPRATVDRLVEDAIASIVRECGEKFIAASLDDPDIAARSADFKAGYAQGVREMSIPITKLLVKRKG